MFFDLVRVKQLLGDIPHDMIRTLQIVTIFGICSDNTRYAIGARFANLCRVALRNGTDHMSKGTSCSLK